MSTATPVIDTHVTLRDGDKVLLSLRGGRRRDSYSFSGGETEVGAEGEAGEGRELARLEAGEGDVQPDVGGDGVLHGLLDEQRGRQRDLRCDDGGRNCAPRADVAGGGVGHVAVTGPGTAYWRR